MAGLAGGSMYGGYKLGKQFDAFSGRKLYPDRIVKIGNRNVIMKNPEVLAKKLIATGAVTAIPTAGLAYDLHSSIKKKRKRKKKNH